ncbi:camphor resistance protein CrcB [Cellulomonas fimi]|uniref:Fluoride-specific ion channel FluC n=1 Tax=Cellulomonas fimi (strain ATCC 484 / DSM 20113 / JCM 1341 / CCUG 24087 / LMG 16345 / NBRC 15513 / NCIMB 8980 / NCTC 7547 / NRS-133) TaxID=590998 RepID=F4H414_CELFA|nr:camphor resistance protein CrcB [Cellulomonas fimi]AEE45366.1 Camphor resistance CrcB protein [Cellulomonas fimi ATCC 484]NNH08155.1 camphor resistance protein CrcB [Cellulomonas fimi]VEH29127.1 camphor resistance protein CrcB [Cellulomonas fimi]
MRLHRDPRLVVAVAAGGAVGTVARYGLAQLLPPGDGVPWATLTANVVGAFLLGLLLEALARSGPDVGRRRLARLGLGTGVLGGFTTYSAFAVELDARLRDGHALLALGYAAGSIALGLAACALGVVVGARRAAP